jgi:clan AA aspartic protease
MIVGTVNLQREAVIVLRVGGLDGNQCEIQSILDTGFTGSLTLPATIIDALKLPLHSRSSAVLANGHVENFNVYAGVVIWDGEPRAILIQEIDSDPLLGMNLLANHDVRIRVAPGGRIEIAPVE